MRNWEFWDKGETQELTLEDVLKECRTKKIEIWPYSDRHKLDKINVIMESPEKAIY